jgi:type VI protein secretion system component Hcp
MSNVSPRTVATSLLVVALVAGVLALTGSGAQHPANAAPPVPAVKATCPAPSDPSAVSRTTASFMLMPGVLGDGTGAHAGAMVLSSVRVTMLGGNSTLCGGAGGATIDPVVVEKGVDRATATLNGLALTGVSRNPVKISVWSTGTGAKALMTYTLANVRVVSDRVVQRGSSLTEEVSMTFDSITIDVIGLGGSSFCWNRLSNQIC